RWGRGRWMPPAFVALAIVSGGLYWWQVDQQSGQISCQAQFYSAFTTGSRARAAAAEADRKAQDARDDNQDALFTGVAALIVQTDPNHQYTPEEQAAIG